MSVAHNDSYVEESTIKAIEPTQYKKAIATIFRLAIPTFVSNFIDCLNEMVALHYISLLGNSVYMGAVGLGIMFTSMTATNILYGFGIAYQTYSSQCFGRKDYYMLNVYHYRIRLLQILITIPLGMISLFSNKIFLFLGIDSEVAHYAHIYTLVNLPFCFILIQYDILRTFLRSQQIVNPVMVMSVFAALCGPFLQYLWVFTFGMGFLGNSIARLTQISLNFAMLIIYVIASGCCKESLGYPNWNCFKDFMPLIKLGCSSAMMLCFQSWCYQILNVITGVIGKVYLATNVAMNNVLIYIFRSCWGIAIASGILVGNSIGALKASLAKLYFLFSIAIDIGMITVFSIVVLIIKKWLAEFYSKDIDVQIMFENNIYLVCIVEVFDIMNAVCNNTFSGLGKQFLACLCSLFSYYAVMLPLAYELAFKLNMKLHGLYLSIIVGAVLQFTLYIITLYRLSWKSIAVNAKEAHEKQKLLAK